jgi:hypothetical protein
MEDPLKKFTIKICGSTFLEFLIWIFTPGIGKPDSSFTQPRCQNFGQNQK